MPCPRNINIAAILRFQTLFEVYGFRVWAEKLYSGLEVKADVCNGCGECELKCPFKLPIQNKLQIAQQEFLNKC
jgi:predicted aldo/keto reductase-like oxidoreductase